MDFLNYLSQTSRRSSNDDQEDYFSKLPPLYKEFVKTFEFSRNTYIRPNCFCSDNFLEGIGSFIFDVVEFGDYFEIYFFLSMEEAVETKHNHYDLDEILGRLNLFPIGSTSFNGLISVGIGSDNQDKIFLDIPDWYPTVFTVADNIFDFVRKVTFKPQVRKQYFSDHNHLYRNWNEPFWRIRGESDDTPPPII